MQLFSPKSIKIQAKFMAFFMALSCLFFMPLKTHAAGAAGAGGGGGGGGGSGAAPSGGGSGRGFGGASGPAIRGGGGGIGGSLGGSSGSAPLGKGASPIQLGTMRAQPARYDASSMSVIPNINNIGYYGQFSNLSPNPWGNNPLNLNTVYQPLPAPNVGINTQSPYLPQPMFTMPQPQNPLVDCIQGVANMITGQAQISQMQMMADDANERLGPRKHSSFNREANRSILRNFTPHERTCQKFIDKQGSLGPWGDTLLDCMHWESNRDIFGYNENGGLANGFTPSDVARYCPSFSQMDQARRDRFWVWFFMSVAAPESSCDPGNVGQGPNGSAIGLFQLEADKCNAVHVPVSSADLMRPEPNIRCACSLFAKEMRNRSTIFIGTSRGRAGTYWATLRSDSADAGNVAARRQVEFNLASYKDCHQ